MVDLQASFCGNLVAHSQDSSLGRLLGRMLTYSANLGEASGLGRGATCPGERSAYGAVCSFW